MGEYIRREEMAAWENSNKAQHDAIKAEIKSSATITKTQRNIIGILMTVITLMVAVIAHYSKKTEESQTKLETLIEKTYSIQIESLQKVNEINTKYNGVINVINDYKHQKIKERLNQVEDQIEDHEKRIEKIEHKLWNVKR